jgi:hypothetical protein
MSFVRHVQNTSEPFSQVVQYAVASQPFLRQSGMHSSLNTQSALGGHTNQRQSFASQVAFVG